MATHRISIDLNILTAQFNQQMAQLQNKLFGTFGTTNKGLKNSFFGAGGAFQTAAWINAFDSIQSAGVGAFNAIGNAINRAAKYQTDLIGTANNYQSALGISFKDSIKLSQDVNTAMLRNAALPFGEFRKTLSAAFGDDILAATMDRNNPQLSIGRLADTIGALSVGLGGITGVTDIQRRDLVGKVLYSNAKGVRGIEGYTNSPLFQRNFDNAIAAIGGDSAFNNLSRSARVSFLQRVADGLINKDTIEGYKNSFGGRIGQLNTLLFDDQSGIFSFARKLPLGNSLIDSMGILFAELLTPGGIFDVGGAILKGFVDGVFVLVRGVTDGIAFILKPVNALFKILQPLNPAIYALSFALSTLATVGIAKLTASTITSLASQGVGGLVASLGIGGLPGVMLTSLPKIIPLLQSLPSIGFSAIIGGFKGLAAGVGTFSTSLLALAVNPVFWAITGIVTGIAIAGYTIWKYWKPLSAFFGGFWEGFLESMSPVIEALGIFTGAWEMLVEVMKPVGAVFKRVMEAFQPLVDATSSFFNLQQEDATQANFNSGKSVGKSFGNTLQAPFRLLGILNPFDIFNNVSRVYAANAGRSADGNLMPLFSAIAQESRDMPPGANLEIANSSEAILNRPQQQMIASALSGKSGGNRMGVQIIIQGFNGNVDDLANRVKSVIEQQWSDMLYDEA